MESAAAILLGQTGSGKSTIINMLTNYFRGPRDLNPDDLSDLKVMIPTRYRDPTEDDFGAPTTEATPEDGGTPKPKLEFGTTLGRYRHVVLKPVGMLLHTCYYF
jgi:hypothetical protein